MRKVAKTNMSTHRKDLQSEATDSLTVKKYAGVTLQLDPKDKEKLVQLSKETGLSQAVIVGYLVRKNTSEDFVKAIKDGSIKKRPLGRAKGCFHEKLP